VTFSFARFLYALAALVAWVTPLGAEHWQLQYFYDQNKSSLAIADLCVCLGRARRRGGEYPRGQPAAAGGAGYLLMAAPAGSSSHSKNSHSRCFFLNENFGWMVTEKGLWQTTEAGRSWTKLPRVPGQIFRVYFKGREERLGRRRQEDRARDPAM